MIGYVLGKSRHFSKKTSERDYENFQRFSFRKKDEKNTLFVKLLAPLRYKVNLKRTHL